MPRDLFVTARGLSHLEPGCKITYQGVTMTAKCWASINPLLPIHPNMRHKDT